ncbi:MAG: SDR family NAD(P)-dependent oxidoreductase [Vicinamibacterales bacterium]
MAAPTPTVAVVTGASRGAGKGIALALGDTAATVYCVGRTRRGGAPPIDGAPGTIDDTADEVTARGGRGIAVAADCTDAAQVAALFAQVERDHGGLDVLANAVWGGHDLFQSVEDWMASTGRPFWTDAGRQWASTIDAGPRAYLLASAEAARLMTAKKRGLITGITDFVFGDADLPTVSCHRSDYMPGMLFPDLAHQCINRLMFCLAQELKASGVAVVTLMPGFMRTERVERSMTSDKLKKMFRYDLSESVAYVGRAVAALAADRRVVAKTGRIHYVADLAEEYGFTDADGTRHPRFNPFT